jgi:hypothetical protein
MSFYEVMSYDNRLIWTDVLILGFFPPILFVAPSILSARSARLIPVVLSEATPIVKISLSFLSSDFLSRDSILSNCQLHVPILRDRENELDGFVELICSLRKGWEDDAKHLGQGADIRGPEGRILMLIRKNTNQPPR